MAKWSKEKVNADDINGGQEYKRGDRLSRQQLNSIINNSLYASNIAEKISNQILNLDSNEKIEFKGSNPNLLINGDFIVNQRGQESYTELGKYTFDRWIKWFDGSLTKTDNAIQLTNTGSANVIQQVLEDKSIIGKMLTLSMEYSTDGSNYNITSCSGILGTNIVTNEIDSIGFGLGNKGLPYINIKVAQNTTLYVKYIKLELGSIATPYSPRPYAEELAMCQRYYQKVIVSCSGISGNSTPATIRIFVHLSTKIRVKPTMQKIELYGHQMPTGYIGSTTSYYINKLSDNGLYLVVTFENLKNSYAYIIESGGNELELDAEIY